MRIFILNIITPKLIGMLILASCMISFSSSSFADSRSEARKAVLKLRQIINPQKVPDELASIETTFSVAEQYKKQNNLERSEQYYLLTIQKARILNNMSSANPAATEEATITPAASSTVQTQPFVSSQSVPQPTADTNLPAPDAQTDPVIDKIDPATKATDTQQNAALPASEQEEYKEDEQDDFLDDTVASEYLVGNPSIYTVRKNDTIRLISAKLGVTRQHLMELNGLNNKSILKAGQQLKYNNRKIIPQQVKNGIIINIPEKTLYYFKRGKLTKSIPVALGAAAKNKKFDWKTPTGKFKIIAKQKDPTWHVPSSIQEEMEDEGKEVITSIPPGPKNPLGKYAFKTTLPGILIHSTTKPGSIYSFASHGCIRVYPKHMEEFFNEITVNTSGEIIYRPVKLANTETGRIFLEVHQDVYGKSAELNQVAKRLIEKKKLSDRVNWDKVRNVIKQKAGIAEDITL